MKVLYINLEKDIERRCYMEKQLNDYNFLYERIIGVDGRSLQKRDIENLYDSETSAKYNKHDLMFGEIGCALSHKKCHEIALKHDYTLVLEDDVDLPANFKELVERSISINEKNNAWEYLQFDYQEPGLIFIKKWFLSIKIYMSTYLSHASFGKKFLYLCFCFLKCLYILPISLFEGIRNNAFKVFGISGSKNFYRPLYLTGAYLITKKGAEKLLKFENKIVFTADGLINYARKKGLKHKAFVPLVVRQNWQRYGSTILGFKGKNNTM